MDTIKLTYSVNWTKSDEYALTIMLLGVKSPNETQIHLTRRVLFGIILNDGMDVEDSIWSAFCIIFKDTGGVGNNRELLNHVLSSINDVMASPPFKELRKALEMGLRFHRNFYPGKTVRFDFISFRNDYITLEIISELTGKKDEKPLI